MSPTVAKKPAAKKKAAAKKSSKKIPSREFRIFAPDAQEVFVVGEFDNWEIGKNRMRRFKDGVWKKKIQLKEGRYQYRFLVDGAWWSDPECEERCSNPYGSENSVVTIG